MALPRTPKKKAQRMARSVYTKVRSNPQDYLEVSESTRFDERVLLYAEGFKLNEPLRLQLDEEKRWGKALEQMEFAQQQAAQSENLKCYLTVICAREEMETNIVDHLRSGAQTHVVQDYISKHQCWPFLHLWPRRKSWNGRWQCGTRMANAKWSLTELTFQVASW